MSVLLLASMKVAARTMIAASSLSLISVAMAAGDPPTSADPAPATVQSDATPSSLLPIPLNSGTAPQEFAADASKVTMERLPNGTRVYHMNGQGMQSLVAHLNANGKIEYTCSDKVEQIINDGAEHAHEQ
jgi:hypothetical protein